LLFSSQSPKTTCTYHNAVLTWFYSTATADTCRGLTLLEVEELQEKATQGRTQPWLCRLSDDQLYYIKGPQATTKGLINEAVCAFLGKAFGLNVPAHYPAYLPAQLLTYNKAAR
jgi:hypothetical protein